jgi:Tfp pilus assembly protein PilF
MGGRDAIHDFFRLFLLPGVHHCAGGPGPGTIDAITAIENWVERGIAPDELLARRFVSGVEQRSRPAYPYPLVARYQGTGDPMHATSFVPSDPPTLQYRSPAGVAFYSLLDTGAVARADSALAADPRNIDRIVQLGVAQSGARQFREAIRTFTRGMAIAPANPMLYRWRGHRYLSVREFDRARTDLTRGFALDSTNYGILYHLGIVRYARGDFAGAADAFARAQRRAPEAGELAGSTDWLWMSLMRAGRSADARAMLERRPDSLPVANAYSRRLKLYRGEITPDSVFTPADTADVQVATLSYGVGNWYLVRGDTAQARQWFERSVRSGGWPGFGFIISELELRRLRGSARR